MKGDRSALSYLQARPSANGIPDGLLTVEFKPAERLHPTEPQFVHQQMLRRLTDK
jgi:hypothetical protein